MNFYQLRGSDIQISKIGFGAWGIIGGANWGPQQEKDSIEALQAAFEAGINFFDTAEAYGDGASENLIDKALADVRDQIVIATKIKPDDFAYDDVIASCNRRLKALNTDVIDLLQLHWPNHAIPVDETLRALEDLKSSGKIRALGVSNFGKQDLQECFAHSQQIAANQVPYSLLWRAIEYDILPACQQEEVAILCYSPLMQGLLTGKFDSPQSVPDERARTRHFSKDRPQSRHDEAGVEEETFIAIQSIQNIARRLDVSMGQMSIAWLCQQPGIGSVIVGGRNAHQARQNAAASQVTLERSVLEELSQVTQELKVKLGRNPDMWQSESRYR